MIIQDIVLSRSSGTQYSQSQYLFQSIIIKPTYGGTNEYEYNIPTFNPSGASFDYYSQNVDTISTNLNNQKIIRFNWLKGTESLTGNSFWRQEIYTIPYDSYNQFLTTTGSTQQALLNQIDNYLNTPLVTIDIPASSITISGYYDYLVPNIVKPVNNFAQQLFIDKSQYFIDSKLVFSSKTDNTIGDFIYQNPFDGTTLVPPIDITNPYVRLNTDGLITGITSSSIGQLPIIVSEGKKSTIDYGVNNLVTGLTVNGAYFVYFVVPKKPNIDVINGAPSVLGILSTFSPIFNFNTVDDGDYYKLDVNYDTNDISFTGNQKAEFIIPQQPGDPEFIRSYSTPLSPGVPFIYRIGNTKELINIFGVKQNVTTWGRIASAYTANDGKFNVSGHVYQTYIQYGPPITGATISFYVVTNTSAVDLGSDTTNYSGITGSITQPLGGGVGSTFSTITDANGYYYIPGVPGGWSQVTLTSPLSYLGNPIFSSSTELVNITQDTGKDYNLSIYWGFSSLTFNEFENYQFV